MRRTVAVARLAARLRIAVESMAMYTILESLAVRGCALVRLPAEDRTACRPTSLAIVLIAACARNTGATGRNDSYTGDSYNPKQHPRGTP